MNHTTLANRILSLVGGPGNVACLVHCATRLPFPLNDNGQASKAQSNSVASEPRRFARVHQPRSNLCNTPN